MPPRFLSRTKNRRFFFSSGILNGSPRGSHEMPLIIESNDLFSRLKMIDRLRRFPVTQSCFPPFCYSSSLLDSREEKKCRQEWLVLTEGDAKGGRGWNAISRMLHLSRRWSNSSFIICIYHLLLLNCRQVFKNRRIRIVWFNVSYDLLAKREVFM